jgi:protein-S-isoprenylcysteine O-methyltransferase Ste14
MNYVLIGSLSFVFFYLFDLNKIKLKITLFNGLFALGAGLLFFSSIMLIFFSTQDFTFTAVWVGLFYFLSLSSCLFMLYALFGALPFKKTYVKGSDSQLVDTGVYALCRHPGVWGFFFMYLFAFLASGRWIVLWACVIWTALDILHVWIQDVFFFPKMIDGYTRYQEHTPFLAINRLSVQHCLHTLKK